MAYAQPKQWDHGDVPTGTEMQKYSDSLNYLQTQIETYTLENMACWCGEGDDTHYVFVNVHPWLYYTMDDGTAEIIDPDNPDNSQSLSETDAISEGAFEKVDLYALPWMYPGKLYYVNAVDGCFEHWYG